MKETLNKQNIQFASTITNKKNPDWGTWGIIQEYDKGIFEIRGDSGDKVLNEEEFHFWQIETYKEGTPKPLDYNLCYNAHRNTSFSPEKRAESHIREFRNTLIDTKEEMKKVPHLGDNLESEYEIYEKKAREKYTSWLYARGNCISSMITGPSNFPTRRAEKANNTEHKRMNEWIYFQDNYIKKLTKRYKPVETVESELLKNQNKLKNLETWHQLMKDSNKLIRSKKLSEEEKISGLIELGYKETQAIDILKPDARTGRVDGYLTWQLQNNNANIKRTRARVEELLTKATSTDEILHECDLFKCEVNRELDRIMFFFDGKPSDEIRTLLKRNAFKWSPRNAAWQRKVTNNALYSTKHLIKDLTQLEKV